MVEQLSFVDAVAIPIGRGLFALVDPEDRQRVTRHRWRAQRLGKTFYAYRCVREGGVPRHEFMHRFLLGLPKGEPGVDHANGNGLDNRRANLRVASKAENGRNRGPNCNNTSGYKRVCWHKGAGKWLASIQVDRRQISLGLYDDPIDAAIAYDLAAIEHHGEFAWTNFVRPPKREHAIPFATRASRWDSWKGAA